MIIQFLKISAKMLILFTFITGVIYPGILTIVGQSFFPFQANGSLIPNKGSVLLGQAFVGEHYFWGRPMRPALPPSDPQWKTLLQEDISYLTAHNDSTRPIPLDLVTTSASRLDPHISPQAAYYQVPRIAASRQLQEAQIEALVQRYTQKRTLGIWGEPRVNVLLLNHALDKLNNSNNSNNLR